MRAIHLLAVAMGLALLLYSDLGAPDLMLWVFLGLFAAGLAIVGMCDAGEEGFFRRGLAAGGFGPLPDRIEMERLGFFVCDEDLEDELIRASGRAAIEALLDSQGDLGSFQTLGQQPAWRQTDFEAQMHRWLGAGARRKLRYARLLVLSLDLDRMPLPLTAVLAATSSPTRPVGRPECPVGEGER